MSEARLEKGESGLVPADDGWFVLNAADADWKTGSFGSYTTFEGRKDGGRMFERMGFNISRLEPGQPMCHYHGEDDQEAFLILKGDALLLVEEQERALKEWDLVHMPAWVEHVIVGAGEGCTVLAFGTRSGEDVRYPRSELALRHGAGVEEETSDPEVSYKDIPPDAPTAFAADWLPRG